MNTSTAVPKIPLHRSDFFCNFKLDTVMFSCHASCTHKPPSFPPASYQFRMSQSPVIQRTVSRAQVTDFFGDSVEEIVPFCGCLCFLTSCFTKFPDCVGCEGKRSLLCCHNEIYSCKIPKEGETVWCHMDRSHTYCAPIKQIYMVGFTDYGRLFFCVSTVHSLRIHYPRSEVACAAWMYDAHCLWQKKCLCLSPAAS